MGQALEVYGLLLGCKKKKKNFQIDVIFNIKQIEMGCITFASTQYNLFIKRVKWVGSGQSTLIINRSGQG